MSQTIHTNEFAPNQADFALVTINASEDQAVREVFYDKRSTDNSLALERGIYSWWRMQGKLLSDQFVIVHASTGDAKGPLPAIELLRELDRTFQPRFLLILGTAGGIGERGVEYGRVVYSRQVHTGYQQLLDVSSESKKPCMVQVRLFDDPVQPPSDRLYLHAKKAAVGWEATERMKQLSDEVRAALSERKWDLPLNVGKTTGTNLPPWVDEILLRFGTTCLEPPEATELFSGPYLIDGRNSELFSAVMQTFPKVGAVEMEAGAVAQAVLHSIQIDRFVGYLVIKGISDVVDSDVPHEYRKLVRKTLSKYASVSSAEFAKRMIETWTGTTGQPFGQLSLIPARYSAFFNQELRQKRHSNSIVYEGITLNHYSHLLRHLFHEESQVTSAWTFCYLAPYRFFAALESSDSPSPQYSLAAAKRVLKSYEGKEHLLKKELLRKFPHFHVFSELAKKKGLADERVIRVMHQ